MLQNDLKDPLVLTKYGFVILKNI